MNLGNNPADIPQVECLLVHDATALWPDQRSFARCFLVQSSDTRLERDF